MRKLSGPLRAGVPYARQAAQQISTAHGKPQSRASLKSVAIAGGTSLILISILFWLIFYQNLPGNMGLRAINAPINEAAGPADVSYANTIDRILKICMIGMSLYIIGSRWALTRAMAKDINIGAAALVILCPLSAIWSISPDDTLLRSVTLSAIVLVCFSASLAGWDRQRFQKLALPPLMYILLASLVMGVLFPDQITEAGDDISQKGAWHGITLTKNQFGMAASLAAIFCASAVISREKRTGWAWAGTAVAFLCLILSRSNTSLFAAMLGILFMVLVMRVPAIKQRFSGHVAVALSSTIVLYQLVIQNVLPGAYTLLAPVRALTGKDATFSARTIIWDAIKEHIHYAPYLGSGYGAYWIGPVRKSPSYVFTYLMYFYPTEAHNGYLDIVNDLGYLGTLCLAVFIAVYIRQALQLMKFDRAQAALYLAILFQQMVMNMSESEWFARDSAFTVMLLGIACLSRGLYEARLSAQSTGAMVR